MSRVTAAVTENFETLLSRAVSDQPAVNQLQTNASLSLQELPVENAHRTGQAIILDAAVYATVNTVNHDLTSEHQAAMPSQLLQMVKF